MATASDPGTEPPQQGITLEELGAAFAAAVGRAARAPGPAEHQESAPAAEAPPAEAPPPGALPDAGAESDLPLSHGQPEADSDPCPISPRTILEALLFVGNRQGEPISAQRAAELMRGVQAEEIPGLIRALNARYQANHCPYHIVAHGRGYRLVVREAYHPLRARFLGRVREARLSQAAIDVLAIVAYRQPLTAEDVSRLRGLSSNHVLQQLVHRQLLRIERTADKPRKTLYYTTERFLGLFGLGSLDDLPQSEDLEKR
jgi:segregation and condensation protein B